MIEIKAELYDKEGNLLRKVKIRKHIQQISVFDMFGERWISIPWESRIIHQPQAYLITNVVS